MHRNGTQSFPPGFIDALLQYAMDPTQWESLADELHIRRTAIDELDPSSFLTLLSQAESLAWHMHNQPPTQLAGCAYFLLDENGRVLYASDEAEQLVGLVATENEPLSFHRRQSQLNFDTAFAHIRSHKTRQVPVEMQNDHHSSYGYLVTSDHMPAHFANITSPAYAFLVALQEPSDQVAQVLQASFHLTGAEIAVCLRLAGGLALKEVADELNISANTARNHLQAVFEKTGLN